MSGPVSAKQLALLARVVFLAVSLAILIKIVDLKLLAAHMYDIPLYVLAFLVAMSVFRTWLTGMRWRLITPDESGQLRAWQYFRLLMIANSFNLIMPGALGGDFVKTAMTVKTVKNKRVDNVIAIVADRFIGLLSILCLGSLALLFMSDIPNRWAFYRIFLLLGAAFATLILTTTNPWLLRLAETIFVRLGVVGDKLLHVLHTWQSAIAFFRRNYTRVLLALLMCVPIHGLSFLTKYIVAVYLGIEISFFDVCLILALVWVITSIPITISGAGVRELSMIYFLSFYGVDAEPATALSVYFYLVTVILGFIGLFFLLDSRRTPEQTENNAEGQG